ncbi:hypothetical protein BDZ97DRAFT_975690 [Flammula alnicola]|nr:hypothetical protein BDZ97DRAFT_975690 [Flammula alnicola]
MHLCTNKSARAPAPRFMSLKSLSVVYPPYSSFFLSFFGSVVVIVISPLPCIRFSSSSLRPSLCLHILYLSSLLSNRISLIQIHRMFRYVTLLPLCLCPLAPSRSLSPSVHPSVSQSHCIFASHTTSLSHLFIFSFFFVCFGNILR